MSVHVSPDIFMSLSCPFVSLRENESLEGGEEGGVGGYFSLYLNIFISSYHYILISLYLNNLYVNILHLKGRIYWTSLGLVLSTVWFFSTVTLHDDIAQLPGMQKSLAMAHFVDNKWAFYDLLHLGLFDKNLTFETVEEIWHKLGKKGCYFRFFIEYFSFK